MADSRELSRLWQAVLGHLQLELNRSSYEAWLCGTRPLTIEDGCLVVETPNAIHVEWINSRFSPTVRRALASVYGESLDVRFAARAREDDAPAPREDSRPQPPANLTTGRVNPRLSLQSYHTAPANRLAYDACVALLDDSEGAMSPVAIWGAPGLGKTHLVHGLAMRALAAGWPTACLSAEEFTTRFQEGLRARDVAAFQSAIRGVRLLIVDDLQYLAGKRATQEELANAIDTVVHEGGHVVVAGELHPLGMDLVDRLASRLAAGVTARIEPFEAPERRTFVEAMARDARAALPPWALDRLASPANVSLRLLRGAVATAVARQRSGLLDDEGLAVDMARLAVCDEASHVDRTPADVVAIVAAHYGVTAGEVTGRSRSATLSSARAVAAAALKEQGLSLAQVASALGGRERSTMSPIVRRGRQLLDVDAALRARLAG